MERCSASKRPRSGEGSRCRGRAAVERAQAGGAAVCLRCRWRLLAAQGIPVELAVVGDGPVRDKVLQRAERANALAGRRAVILTGSLDDPRPAYAAADVLLGMGGSALRGMAFEKPLIVQGGAWVLVSPQPTDRGRSSSTAGWTDWATVPFPVDEARLARRAARLKAELGRRSPTLAVGASSGAFGRKLVVERFSLTRAAAILEEVYAAALAAGHPLRLRDAASSAFGTVADHLKRKLQRYRGACPADDFNAIATAGTTEK